MDNFYRPYDRPPNSETPCVPCECNSIGSAGGCNFFGGECYCKEGYTGPKCTNCLSGYRGENCTKCSCDVRGTMPGGECEAHCQCKLHVEGEHCDQCSSGYFSLNSDNAEGCLKCFCSGVGLSCRSSNIEAKFVSAAIICSMISMNLKFVIHSSMKRWLAGMSQISQKVSARTLQETTTQDSWCLECTSYRTLNRFIGPHQKFIWVTDSVVMDPILCTNLDG
jgi:hypothetical protein